ncbi:unnamed protein product [Gongylonema pulchrum]|uniref:VWFA domain-containing protein n=1 Tax=Gongylonema pulchrum TaxID=637853 RepID=A0A183E050_9BILA|nr:unnamed protein product [Gongylonema pulchrum]
MIVLISDGNSQDRWEELLAAADRLRATDANVYAVTASHDYYFRELELYAGSKWLVYVDARKRQFLDDAELSVMQCQSPANSISSPAPSVCLVFFYNLFGRMIVLISDGNSQDRWEELLAAADRLRATDANVYAVTASHDYYFRELELYAGSKWLVYVDARKRQFLDDAELSVMQCQSPENSISSPAPSNEFTVTAQTPFALSDTLLLSKVSSEG